MKKLFMIAAVAALGLGAYSCQNGPGNDGPTPGDGSQTGMNISVVMPGSSATTRATNFGDIDATDDESTIYTLDVYVFDADGNKAVYGGHTPINDFDAEFYWDGDKEVWRRSLPFDAIAGEGVKVYVGANLPLATREKGAFGTEALLLKEIAGLAALSEEIETEGIDMFSDLTEVDLEAVPVGESFDEQGDEFNDVTVNMFRVVSKAAASLDNASADDFVITWANESGVVLTYTASHWRVMQFATESWVAPHYSVENYNTNVASAIRPSTYYRWEETETPPSLSTNIAQYDLAVEGEGSDITGEATILGWTNWNSDADDDNLTEATAFKYIGENARIGAANAHNKNTTYAFISTGVLVNRAAEWDTTNNEVAYKDVDGGYGALSVDVDDIEGNTDVYLIRYDGAEYVTDTEAKAQRIAQGFAGPMNIVIGVVPDPTAQQPDLIYMTMADFQEDYDFEVYIFHKGYVHFMHWINGYPEPGLNNYEVLRNQFIHLSVSGLNQTNADNSTFPGYPGDEDYPRKPIDPVGDDLNNPDPLKPEDPVDPTKTQMDVLVKIHNWTYRYNDVVLGR